ncbi:MAG: polymer-forming cytoskeletal protein [Lachnospiraceae bacterium]|nr:polymer-forming cytoskeletal protein [Lachnospiraceae bacterium]
MGFFKEFKDDFSEAVDEIFPGDTSESLAAPRRDAAANRDKLDSNLDVDGEFSKLNGLLEKVPARAAEPQQAAPTYNRNQMNNAATMAVSRAATMTKEEAMDTNTNEIKPAEEKVVTSPKLPQFDSEAASDENAVITSGMTIKGDLESTGSIEVDGTINGDVRCNGKLTVMGVINGNSTSSEFFADSAKIQGEVMSSGTVKIGVGSVVVGNITASSAVIAGAVKGNIDVQGLVVVDTSAVVMGDIKSRSVQINNGAVIQGFCSQAYADVDVESVFGA